ncbi:hypothetical protein AB4Y45_33190 [Paraburkholderia sp. EG287A]|uniref:hypothetical protein n=1 Tax=Paraburkholderia sp. EG287A TaxID=3237012 RepID=UPI0034D242E5
MKVGLEQLAAEAHRGCGLSWDLFVDRFSAAVDGVYPPSAPVRAIALAAKPMGYAAPEERAAAHAQMREQGYCSHGIERDCCPAGCGDIEF